MAFKTDYHLMQVKSIAESSKGSILQYFPPSLSYHLSLRSFLSIFEWPLKTGLTVSPKSAMRNRINATCSILTLNEMNRTHLMADSIDI